MIVASGEDIGPIKMQEEICRGTIKNDRMWEGEFLRWEHIPNSFSFGLMKQKYKAGKLVASTPFDEKKLPFPPDPSKSTDFAAWPWQWRHHADEWPKSDDRVR